VLVGVGGVVIVTMVVETAASAVWAKRRSAMLVGRRCIVRLVSYTCYTKEQMTGNGFGWMQNQWSSLRRTIWMQKIDIDMRETRIRWKKGDGWNAGTNVGR
jgi:hypothetical protein